MENLKENKMEKNRESEDNPERKEERKGKGV